MKIDKKPVVKLEPASAFLMNQLAIANPDSLPLWPPVVFAEVQRCKFKGYN
jgi:hypothetical protein